MSAISRVRNLALSRSSRINAFVAWWSNVRKHKQNLATLFTLVRFQPPQIPDVLCLVSKQPVFTLVGIGLGMVAGAAGFWVRVRDAIRQP